MLSDAISGINMPDSDEHSTAVHPDYPLNRNVVVSITASLNELCMQEKKAAWTPSPSALKGIFQQRKFTGLGGETESMGDLRSVVLHQMDVTHSKSTFPVAVGASITGVDNTTHGISGVPFSTILLPEAENNNVVTLQKNDVSIAYEFAKKFQGYTAANLSTKGVHYVKESRFALVDHRHPICAAVNENAEALQIGEVSVMPEGLVKISQSLYDTLLPLVRTQVASQVKLSDFSDFSVRIKPVNESSWEDVRSNVILGAKKPIQQERDTLLSAVVGDTPESRNEQENIRREYDRKLATTEVKMGNKPMSLLLNLGVGYNYMAQK